MSKLGKDVVVASTEKLQPLPPEEDGGSEKMSEQAEQEWLEEMTEKADRVACEPAILFSLGQYHFSNQNYSEALKCFEKAAGIEPGEGPGKTCTGAKSSGRGQAMYQLGVMYYDGLGVAENPVKGSAFMLEVAQSKEKKDSNIVPSAQYNIGRAYFMGFGVRQSDSQAEQWWYRSANCGSNPSSVRARHTLGLYYSRQDSLQLPQSYECHLEAAKAGNPESMAAVGVMLIQGQGCDKDEEEGFQWLKESAKMGCVYGEGLLSRQYLAMKLYSKACEAAFRVSDVEDPSFQGGGDMDVATPLPSGCTLPLSRLDRIGIATGCFVLGRCMQLGNGIAKDEARAIALLNKAKTFDKSVTMEMYDQLTMDQL